MIKGKQRKLSSNCSRGVTRALENLTVMYEPLLIKVPCYDEDQDKRTVRDLPILPIHETLDALAPEGSEKNFTDFVNDSQRGFELDLKDWAARIAVTLSGFLWMCLALWGDGAPYNDKDSLLLVTFCILNGLVRDR